MFFHHAPPIWYPKRWNTKKVFCDLSSLLYSINIVWLTDLGFIILKTWNDPGETSKDWTTWEISVSNFAKSSSECPDVITNGDNVVLWLADAFNLDTMLVDGSSVDVGAKTWDGSIAVRNNTTSKSAWSLLIKTFSSHGDFGRCVGNNNSKYHNQVS